METEKRPIDANAFVEWMKSNYCQYCNSYEGLLCGACAFSTFITHIETAPTVDAVEVVRCKDCVSYEEQCPGFGYCYHWDYEQGMSPNQVDADDFCSYGERRTDEALQ